MIIRDREPSENIPWLVVRGDEACWFMCSRLVLKKVPSLADLGVVDRVSDNNKWIQRGTWLADWQNTRTGNAAASIFSVKSTWTRPKRRVSQASLHLCLSSRVRVGGCGRDR